MNRKKTIAAAISAVMLFTYPLQTMGMVKASDESDSSVSVESILTEEIQSMNAYTEGEDYAAGQAYFEADSEEEAQEIAESYNATLESFEEGIGVITFDTTVEEKMEEAKEDSSVKEAIYPDYLFKVMDTETDPDIDEQWQHDAINDEDAWKVSNGDGVKVAVIDNGFMADHEDLEDNVKGTYNAVDGSTDVTQLSYDSDGEYQHGTHVAGIIAAVSNNGLGGCGVAPNADLYLVKVSDSNGDMSISSIIKALNWAAENEIDVVNMSLGTTSLDSQTKTQLQEAVDAVYDAGGVLVAAAGNSGVNRKNYPAALDNVIAVGATGETSGGSVDSSQLAYYSNYGSWVDLAAPGTKIYSTVPVYESSSDTEAEDGYDTMSGTSMATPVVAGVVALIYGANSDLIDNNSSSASEAVADDLLSTTDGVTYSNSKSGGSITGCVDAAAAVESDVSANEGSSGSDDSSSTDNSGETADKTSVYTGVAGQKLYFSSVSSASASGSVKYTSSNKKIATVNKKGLIKFKKTSGSVTISMVDKSSGDVYASVVFNVEKPEIVEKKVKALSGVSFNAVNYITTDSASANWISSKPSVASVDSETGVVTVHSKGNAKIYAVYGATSLSDKLGTRKKYKFTVKALEN